MNVRSAALGLVAATAISAAAGSARADQSFALGVFHFNVQYVAGGMVGYYSTPNADIDLDADQIEDLIVTESFAPVLELYEKHPTWGVDIELQGYLLDILAARHPKTLDLLRKLAKSGQIDVDSFHYSDQLFIAHPYDDWAASQDLTAATFAKHDVPLGKSVFCQEGQAATGMAKEMKARAYENLIWPKNLWTYQHGDLVPDPFYDLTGVNIVLGGLGVDWMGPTSRVRVAWTYMDDGELMATDGKNPYFPDIFKRNEKAIAGYEAGVAALEAQGAVVTTVSKYVAAVKKDVGTAKATPPLLDGTWQPNSTGSSHRWLGGGGIWEVDERDNDVQTFASLAHREIAAARTAAKKAGLDEGAALASASRFLALGEVSDATGINPFRGEIEYGLAHLAEATRIARAVIARAKVKLGASITIDPAADRVSEDAVDTLRGASEEAPVSVIITSGDRVNTPAWELVRPGLHRLQVDFGVGDERCLTARVASDGKAPIETTLALQDDAGAKSFNRADFSFSTYVLALPLGMVGLGGGKYLIQDQATVHLGVEVTRDAGDLLFEDETQTAGEPTTWVFYVLEGSAADAAAFARSLNDRRTVAR